MKWLDGEYVFLYQPGPDKMRFSRRGPFYEVFVDGEWVIVKSVKILHPDIIDDHKAYNDAMKGI